MTQITEAEGSPLTLGNGQPKPAGTWDWYGAYDPAHHRHAPSVLFSIGVFQWLPKQGKGVKRGKSVARFTGPVSHPQGVYIQARTFIAQQAATEPPTTGPALPFAYPPTLPEIPVVTGVEQAFGTMKHLPAMTDGPPDLDERHPAYRYVCAMFSGPRSVLDSYHLHCRYEMAQEQGEAVITLITAHLQSYGPKHEHKMLGCAILLDRYFNVRPVGSPA
jgi:hypothetical protein